MQKLANFIDRLTSALVSHVVVSPGVVVTWPNAVVGSTPGRFTTR